MDSTQQHPTEIEVLFRDHAPRVYRLAYRYFGNAEAAEDATQETFLRALQRYAQFRHEAQRSTWLYRIAVRVCLDGLRRDRRTRYQPLDQALGIETMEQPADELAKRQLALAVRRVIDQLRPRHKLLIVLRELEELSYGEIHRVTGLSIGTISSGLNRARQEIFRQLRGLPQIISG